MPGRKRSQSVNTRGGKTAKSAAPKRRRTSAGTAPAPTDQVNPQLVEAVTIAVVRHLSEQGLIKNTSLGASVTPAQAALSSPGPAAPATAQAALASSTAGSPVTPPQATLSTPDLAQITETAAGSAVSQIQSGAFPPGLSSTTFTNTLMPLAAQIPSKVKQQIWEGKYVDMGQLISNQAWDNVPQLSVDEQGAISVQNSSRPAAITHIHSWSKAFRIFQAIMGVKYPEQAQSLIRYFELVCEMAHNMGFKAAHYYDCQFRMLKSISDLHWDTFHVEIYSKAMLLRPTGPSQASQGRDNRDRSRFNKGRTEGRSKTHRIPKGYCFSYHEGKKCTINPCQFKHECPSCNKAHPLPNCKATKQNDTSGQKNDD